MENRHGNDLATKFFPNLAVYTDAVRKKKIELREYRKAHGNPVGDTGGAANQVASLKLEIRKLKADKSAAINAELDSVAQKALLSSFKISLTAASGPGGKPVYKVDGNAETFFVVKQLQNNLRYLYKVKQSNRHDLVAQVRASIQNSFPLEMVRTDISSFYESIDRQKLLHDLEQDHLLSPASKKYIKQILDTYGVVSGGGTGIPRGVGISPYLSELYLRSLDRSIRSLPGVVLYCRYVDDVVVVFTKRILGSPVQPYEDAIQELIVKNGFTPNPAKTFSASIPATTPIEFEYLGYLFRCHDKVSLAPSTKKIDKYRQRMKASFGCYQLQRVHDPRGAYRDLKARIRFLTGNTHLVNSKSGAAVGVYYSNPLADDVKSLEDLDKELKVELAALKSGSLRKALKQYSFSKGFVERHFRSFNTQELQRIVAAWKHG